MGWLRHPKTTQEIRANITARPFLDTETTFKVKVRGKRASANLPNLYDDEPRYRKDRSWKRFRKTKHR